MKEPGLLLEHSFGKGLAALDFLDFGDVGLLKVLCQSCRILDESSY